MDNEEPIDTEEPVDTEEPLRRSGRKRKRQEAFTCSDPVIQSTNRRHSSSGETKQQRYMRKIRSDPVRFKE